MVDDCRSISSATRVATSGSASASSGSALISTLMPHLLGRLVPGAALRQSGHRNRLYWARRRPPVLGAGSGCGSSQGVVIRHESVSRNRCSKRAFKLGARHEGEASGPLVVRLVEGVEKTARDESREHGLGGTRCVDDNLAAVGETNDVNGHADDVHGEVSLRVLELRNRSEPAPNGP